MTVMPGEGELLLRLLLACALGGAVGLEREWSGQGAGFRTHLLLSLGCCLFTLVSAYGFGPFLAGTGAGRFDPTRIAAQVVTGVGFIGGGAILRSGTGIHGLTTAASLWVVSAIGVAAGGGFYAGAALTAGLALVALWGLRRLRDRVAHEAPRSVELSVRADPTLDPATLLQALGTLAARVDRLHIGREEDARAISIAVKLPPERRPEEVALAVSNVSGVRDVEWSR
jgi:putative Mg2+ transporter-C (MgtC) family protein